MSGAYYNEHDPFAAAWLRNLIADGCIAPGEVDERDIRDVCPDDLRGFVQCHFFAGIGGWSLAARLAGWPDDRPLWTGSCPCQPFSAARQGAGFADERHLWPSFFHLIDQCRPSTILGEQVASKDGLQWLDLVFADLEGAGYARAAVDLCAAGVGAPHIRQRLWFVGVTYCDGRASGRPAVEAARQGDSPFPADRQPTRPMADARREGRRQVGTHGPGRGAGSRKEGVEQRPLYGSPGELADGGIARLEGCDARAMGHECETVERGRSTGELGNPESDGERQPWLSSEGLRRQSAARGSSPWGNLEWLPCRDGKARPTKPGIFPLAHGVPNRVGTLRGAGNAIVPPLAAEFIKAVMEISP